MQISQLWKDGMGVGLCILAAANSPAVIWWDQASGPETGAAANSLCSNFQIKKDTSCLFRSVTQIFKFGFQMHGCGEKMSSSL